MSAAERQARRAGRVQPLPSVLPRIEQQQARNAAIIQRLADGASMQTVAKEFGITRQRVSKIAFRVTGRSTRPPISRDSLGLQNASRRCSRYGRRVETRRHRAEVGRFWIRDRGEGTSFKAAAAPSNMAR